MKKVYSVVSFVLFLLFASLFIGCSNEPVHQHSFSTIWSADETNHWHGSTCGHEVVIDKSLHFWKKTIDAIATCTKEGSVTNACTVCGFSITEVLPLLSHDWDDGVVITAASCSSTGLKRFTCSVCGTTKEVVIPMLDHVFSEEWTTDLTYHWHDAICGHDSVSGKAEHSWNQGEVTTPATHTTNGVKTYTCTICGKTTTEVIPALVNDHTYSQDWTSNATHHWHEATCGHDARSGEAEHVIPSGLFSCSVCGYTVYPYLSVDNAGVVTCTDKVNLPAELVIPSSLNGIDITAIGVDAFYGCEVIQTVQIPYGVTTIDENAFHSCVNLTSVSIPNTVTAINGCAFFNCMGLESVSIPSSSAWIGGSAFACNGLISVIVPEGVETMAGGVFQMDNSLVSVTLPVSLTGIPSSCFYESNNLSTINYSGTTAQWEALPKDDDWNSGIAATQVICSNGSVDI